MRRRSILAWLCTTTLAPLAASVRAQGRVYRMGILGATTAPWLTDPLFSALKGHGWSVGQNLHVETRITGGDYQRAPALAKELLEQRLDVMVTITTGNAVAARQVTSSVPIVMFGSGYPVEAGLAKSLARPGGNVTGVSVYGGTEIWGKYVSLMRELLPSMRRLGVLFGYVVSDRELEPLLAELHSAARALNVTLRFWRNRSDEDLTAALSEIPNAQIDALLVTGGPVHVQPANIARINELALRRRLPMISDVVSNVFLGGGLIAYSFTAKELADRCASMIDRILRGAKPGDMPIEFPTRFELIVNMKTARALRLTLPQAFLLRVDRVIE